MNKVIKLFGLLLLILVLASCGSKKNPTGGPEDLEKPTVLTTLPPQYGQLGSGRIEINFSKPLDKSSVTQAIYIYPPVADKKVTVDKNTLLIRLYGDLLPDTNYYVTISTRLKDLRGNALAENQTLVFANGDLNNLRIAGNFEYENPADLGLPVQMSLLSADSLLVMNMAMSGPTYALEALNPASYILRAYIDKDQNGRYDFSREPWFEQRANLDRSMNLNLTLAYADTTRPVIRTALGKSPREIEVTFSEPAASYGSVNIVSSDTQTDLPILISRLRDNKMTLLTARQESFSYFVEVRQLRDLKGNTTPLERVEFRSVPEDDTTAPFVTFTDPRNGTSVNNLEPVLEVRFSEIIPISGLKARLTAARSSAEVPLDIIQSDSDIYLFQPRQPLQNYRSYVLSIFAEDISGNKMQEEFQLNFLPLLRTE
ncbi:MAG: Ig-like domain-containing protein [Candidatus Syntrophosphaera sp.]|nr:Ig-like domain-containing protein [Candidatus Syntrophosphaera sp.]